MSENSRFETLSDVLFSGPVVATDIQLVPGTDPSADREALSDALLASMERVGLVHDGRLVAPATRRNAAG